MKKTVSDSRRQFLISSTAATAAASMSTIVPSSALGLDANSSPGEMINLGVVGIGPRCTYDLTAMLKFKD